MKKLLGIILTLIIVISLSSCVNTSDATTQESVVTTTIDPNTGQNTIVDTSLTYSSIAEVGVALAESLTVDQKNVTLPSEYTTGVYEITEAGNYYFTGDVTSAITVKKNSGNVHIYLDNVSMSVVDDTPISSKMGANVTITLIGNNTISNSLGSKEKDKHVIESKENLVINGTGTLTINSTKSAIATESTFIGLGGTINISAVKNGIVADSIYLNGLTINALSTGKDLIHAESDYDGVDASPTFDYSKGFVYILNAVINTTTVLGDAIQADSFVYVKDGTFNLTTTPTWNNAYVATSNGEKGLYSASTHQKVSTDSVRKGSTYATLEESVKGIKVGEIDYTLSANEDTELEVESDNYTILIEGGTFNINTIDDSIHANSGSVLIYGGNLTINTSDDGIHADKTLKISGNAVINVENSYEGIEAEQIEISGGSITVVALDDGINATNSDLSESVQKQVCQLTISGGRLDVTVNPNGDRDGIDSNGGIKITGGVVISRGPNSEMASPMDAANTVSITGGTVIIVGNAPGTGGRFSGPGRGGMGGPGGEASWAVSSMTKTQSNSKGLSSGSHSVVVDGVTISYTNLYSYSGYTTVFASKTATIN